MNPCLFMVPARWGCAPAKAGAVRSTTTVFRRARDSPAHAGLSLFFFFFFFFFFFLSERCFGVSGTRPR